MADIAAGLNVARRRFGVAILPPAEVAAEIDALRRALDDRQLARLPAHITLVPPVNVHPDEVDYAIDVCRRAAKNARPFGLQLGPPASFLPDSPTLLLEVHGALDALHDVRNDVFRPPLERTLAWPFVPHLTLLDEASEAQIAAALIALTGARYDFHVRALHLLEEQRSHVWEPIAEFAIR